MNGVHDCGGMQCYGPIQYTPSEPPFHATWEARVLALTFGTRYAHNVDIPTFRSDIEALPPVDYLRMSYWEIWFTSLVNRLVANGYVTSREVEVGHSEKTPKTGAASASSAELLAGLFHQRDGAHKATDPARFGLGARVRARDMNPVTHTRLPRFARGKLGTIAAQRGTYDFEDTDEYNQGANPNPVYSVRFAARELWGEQAPPKDFIYLDLWEKYLELA